MFRRLSLVTTAVHAGRRLDDVLAEWLPGELGRDLPRSAVRKMIMAGAIQVAGRPMRRPGLALRAGARIAAAVDVDRLPMVDRTPAPSVTEARVLYEDDALLVLDKPAGLPTHATADARRPHLYGLAQQFLARRSGGAGRVAPYLGLHQRLDSDTSGVVLFTKDPAANAPLAALFARRALAKTYHALTARPPRLPPARWQVHEALAVTGRRSRPVAPDPAGQEAETRFALVESWPGGLLVEARPVTGRKHQIRVHLAGAGLPILGDPVYGRPQPHAPRLMLHALRLALPHPLTGAPLVVESAYPDDFRRLLEALRNEAPERGGTRRR